MAAYKDLIGQKITKVTSNPSEPKTGQMWYNSTDGKLRGLAILEAWASSAPLSTARYGTGGSGTQTAALIAGGNIGPSDTRTTAVEEYNGTGFSAGGALPTATRAGGTAGTQTASFYAGGYTTTNVTTSYTYDGSSWTSIPSLGTARRSLNPAAAGTTTASIVCGGYGGSPEGAMDQVEEYNGSSWSEQNDLPAARANVAACGTQTALIIANGGPSAVNLSFLYDGTNWTAAPNTNATLTGRHGAGTQTDAIVAGGRPPTSNVTEYYDGTSWTTNPATLATARYEGGPATSGTSSEWMIAGGYSTAISSVTEEFTKSTNTITAAAWAAGGTMGQVRSVVGGFGTQTAALMCGGNHPGTAQHANAEQYDGTSFSEQSDMGTARSQLGSCGTLTAGLVFGGDVYPTSPRDTGVTEEWDGSSFSEQNDMSTVRRSIGSFGTQTAAVAAAGYVTAALANVEEYNGSSWTSVTSLPAAFNASGTAGVETAGLVFGGLNPSNPVTAVTVEYDGSNWTSGGSLITGRWGLNGGPVGTQSDALAFGGRTPSSTYYTNTEGYDGTSWSSRPSLASAEYETGKAGTAAAALSAGGNDGSGAKATSEEFTGETTAANIQNFTTS